MKTVLRLGVALLGAWLLPGSASAWFPPPLKIDAGFNVWFNVHHYGQQYHTHAGPWYLYFPHEAHFQVPAPVGGFYPNWPHQWPPQQQPRKEEPKSSDSRNNNAPTQPAINPYGAPRPYTSPLGLSPTGSPIAGPRPLPQRSTAHYQPAPSYWYSR